MKSDDTTHDLVSDRHRNAYRQLIETFGTKGQLDRRQFFQLLSASIAFAGLAGCQIRQPVGNIVPYVRQPEEIVPGRPLFYATAMPLSGTALGLLVESHEGRPTKVEGNPQHPASLGATDVFAQASILDLYDPDRSQTPLYLGEIRGWGNFQSDIRAVIAKHHANQGAGLRILTDTISSPTLGDQLRNFLIQFPRARWHQFEPLNRDNVLAGAQMALGRFVDTIYHFEKAGVVLALDSDFLTSGPGSVRYSHDFMMRRRIRRDNQQTNRLYAVETGLSNTGAIADHRLALQPSKFESFVRRLGSKLSQRSLDSVSQYEEWLDALADDLRSNRGSSIVIAGEQQSPTVHALVHEINQALGNVGNTITYVEPAAINPVIQIESLRQLVSDMDAGQVELLLILGGNPVFDAPVDFKFTERLAKVPLRIHHSLYYNETSAQCQWHINAAHYLEGWSDARAFDGTTSIVQPLIAPLFSGKTSHEILTSFTDQPNRSSYDIIRAHWIQNSNSSLQFEEWWRRSLRDGVIEDTASKPVSGIFPQLQNNATAAAPFANDGIEVAFRPDPSLYDGRFANNGWLQELPKPLTKLTWDNAAIVSPNTARQFHLTTEPDFRGGEHGENDTTVVELTVAGRSVRAPVWIMPGHPDGVVTVHLGYGRTRAGNAGTSTSNKTVGFDAYQLRVSHSFWFAPGQLRKTELTYPIACTQAHYRMEGRELVRSASLDEYLQNPEFAKREADREDAQVSIYPAWQYKSYEWGMSIDTGTCTGCNACVIACQSENNIPVVGKDEVMHAREMHWLRIDRYFEVDSDTAETIFQPVPCMHCENAPCELVCPVEATSHSDEGLNEMTYNRCVGTRYCSNNCPYKVRRFNFFEYANFDSELVKLQHNPDVTVRSRGVMEKCTYCLQRISAAKIEATKQNRRVQDGEITPACQQACPVEAIVFGDINDPNSRVAKLKQESTEYGMLSELNTRPRTTYLARIRNPNSQLINIESRR